MHLDRVYQVLARVHVGGELRLDCPSGGTVVVDGDPADGGLHLNCSDTAALRDLLRLLGRYRPGFTVRNLRYLKNPLLQELTVRIGDRRLLTWAPDRLPQVRSLGLLLGLLRRE